MVSDEHTVMAEIELVGTHDGAFLGCEPTGRAIRWPGAVRYELSPSGDEIVSESFFSWPFDLWPIDKHYRHIGGSGGAGVGYGAPAAVGAALAHRDAGRLVVNFQQDGDLMYVPGVLWTAAHHKIPLLSVMHNNRAYHQEVMHLQRMALRRRRGVDGHALIGTLLDDPFIDFATIAKGMGVWSAGPIENPDEFGPALREAIAVVESGAPALIDVVAQPR